VLWNYPLFRIVLKESTHKDLWCGDFEADLDHYLDQHPKAPYHSLKSIVDSGLYLSYISGEINGAIAPPKRNSDGTRLRGLEADGLTRSVVMGFMVFPPFLLGMCLLLHAVRGM
jgi:hypothetical protein